MNTTVIVTYLDGTEGRYECYEARVSDGVLWLTQRMRSGKPKRGIPLAAIRTWTADER